MSLLSRFFSRPEPIRARVPREPVRYRFRAREDFFSDEVRSQYCKGDVYSVRAGNDRLDRLCKQWQNEGKVEIV